MHLTQKHKYALLAMVQLGLYYQKGPIQLRVISEAAAIPHSFLEQLILSLKQSDLVFSTRGSKGGYQLSRNPSSISVNEIFSAIESVLIQVTTSDPLFSFWTKFNEQINNYLNQSLEALVISVSQDRKVLMYTI